MLEIMDLKEAQKLGLDWIAWIATKVGLLQCISSFPLWLHKYTYAMQVT